MEERNDLEKMEEIMLPGFRFHPTDEELVGFYLKRKIQQRPLSIELIKQLDIYKYDPWDLPKLATTGEKEWYFYCPRDRKYRNSARPNRVTGAGFWKATGTDRPIYSSDENKCIGLKKSLVFYKGRAAKGIKTDWMMHEFRLPSLSDHSAPSSTRFMDKSTIPPSDSWAICRIFKKSNSTAQRALSQSWVSPLVPEPTASSSSLLAKPTQSATQLGSSTTDQTNYNYTNELQQSTCAPNFSPFDFFSHSLLNPLLMSTKQSRQLPISHGDSNGNFCFSPVESVAPSKSTVDVSSMLLNMSSSMLGDFGGGPNESSTEFGGPQDNSNGFLLTNSLPQVMQVSGGGEDQNMTLNHIEDQWDWVRSIGFPFSLPMSSIGDSCHWKPNFVWDSSTSCPTDQMLASFTTTKCYT